MKTMRFLTVMFASLALAAGLSAQTVTSYGVIKQYDVTQTTSGSPVASSGSPYSIKAYVFGTGLSGTYSFTTPGGSTQNLTIGGSGAEFQSGSYADPAALNAVYANGVIAMAVPNSNGGTQTPNLSSLTGDAFPELPQITTGTWLSGKLQVDPTQNYTINFASFSSFTSDDSYKLTIRNLSNTEVASGFWNTAGTTSFLVNAATLTAGQTYTATLQFNNNFINYGVAITSANGNAGYSTINEFQIQAIPEPSTYAAILGAVALGGVMIRRRRTAAVG